jgi:Arylsulfatase A and related enzymes
VLAFWDFLPTFADLAGVRAPAGIDGISMLPALLGGAQKNHEYLYWEFFERGFQQALRVGGWKGIRNEQGKPLELYNLSTDVMEQQNVAAQHPDVIEKMEKILKTCRVPSEYWTGKEKAVAE